jgi:hypothetical protein
MDTRKIYIAFELPMETIDENGRINSHGPVFHRWLPDGRNDAIRVEGLDGDSAVELWFERQGSATDGIIQFKAGTKEFDNTILDSHGRLDAGHLYGMVSVPIEDEAQYAAVLENRIGSPEYLKLGKRVIQRVWYPAVSRLLHLLRDHYGQFWLAHPPAWDSRLCSLGFYAQTLCMVYSTGDNKWEPFRPDEPTRLVTKHDMGSPLFEEYLTECDWRQVQKQSTVGQVDLGMALLGNANGLAANGHWRHAFVEAATALEVALEERAGDADQSKIQSYRALPTVVKLRVVAALTRTLNREEIDLCERLMVARNRIVHEGWVPSEQTLVDLRDALRVISKLVPGEGMKLPVPNLPNEIRDWDSVTDTLPRVSVFRL